MAQTGIFLDRDGTINYEIEYLRSPRQLRLIPRTADAIHELNQLGLKVFILTNQSGIARGIFTEDDLNAIHTRLAEMLGKFNARVDRIYYCPHHPEGKIERYRKECECRKPKIGMFTKAAEEYDINFSNSYVIGDKKIDMEAGNNCGALTILVLTGYGKTELENCRASNTKIDYVAEDLPAAVQFIKQNTSVQIS